MSGAEPWSPDDRWPEGWYADPWGYGRERRWTGSAWTGETRGGDGPAIGALNGGVPIGPPMPWPGAPEPVADAANTRNNRRWIALVATLAAIALLLGFSITYVAADSKKNNNASSTTPTLPPFGTSPTPSQPPAFVPTPNTGTPGFGSAPSGSTPGSTPGASTPGQATPGQGSSGAGSGSGSATTDPSAPLLQRLVVHQSEVPSTDAVALPPNGATTTDATLDLCNGKFASEALRTARLQVGLENANQDTVFSTEAVLYKNTAATQQAFAELRSVAAHCPSTPVTSPVGEPTVTTTFNAAPDRLWPQVAGVQRQSYDMNLKDTNNNSVHLVAVYLRRGRALLALYFNSPDGPQEAVAGQKTIPAIVNLFERRLAALPLSAITP
jgi:hypothetical protein